MKLFLGYLLLCLLGGVVLRRKPALRVVTLFLLCLLLTAGYYLLNKI